MIVSTKGRYALRVMIDLAEHDNNEYIPLKDIVARQGFSQKYLESIMTVLSKAGLVDGTRGKGGGYKLNRLAEEYSVWSILKHTEGTLAAVTCLEEGSKACPRASECRTLPLWLGLDKTVRAYLEQYSLADLVRQRADGNYFI